MKLRRLIPAVATAIACTFVGNVRADLFLTGDLVGIFRGNDGAISDLNNVRDGDASFRTGVAIANSFRSGVSFTGGSFAGIGEGDTVSLGLLSYFNGITAVGTSSHAAVLDLYLRLSDPSQSWLHLSTMNFLIDATLNAGGDNVPDNFLAGYTAPERALIGSQWVEFSITGVPAMMSVAENSKVDVGNLRLTVGPTVVVTDEASSLLLAALGLGMIAGCRRRAGVKVRLENQPA